MTKQQDNPTPELPSNNGPTPENLEIEGGKGYDQHNFPLSKLQFLNKKKAIVVILCVANILSNSANGLMPVTLSTIEKRYNFKSFYSSSFIAAHEVGVIISVFIVGSLGKATSRPLVISVSLMVTGIGCLMVMLPQFIASDYYPYFWDTKREVIKIDLCQYEDVTKETCPLGSFNVVILFLLGRFLIGLANLPIMSTSFVFAKDFYLEDDYEIYSIVLYLSIAIGPEIGTIISSSFMNLYVDFHLNRINSKRLQDDNISFVGCWWLPYALISISCILGSLVSFGMDRGNYITEDVEIIKSGILKPRSKKTKRHIFQNLENFIILLKSPDFIFMTGFAACQSFVIQGMVFFGPKILENLLIIPVHITGYLFSMILLPAGLLGLISGFLILHKFQFGIPLIIFIELVMSAIVIYMLPVYLLVCDPGLFAGVNYAMSGNLNVTELYADCNRDCHCDTLPYHPICSIHGVDFYSACHAGCTGQTMSIRESLFYQRLLNCSCIPNLRFDETIPSAIERPCNDKMCIEGFIMVTFLTVIIAILHFCYSLNQKFLLEVTKYYDLTSVFILQTLLVKCLGTLPTALIYGYIIDSNCGLWQIDSCGKQDSTRCVRYDSINLAWDIVATNVVFQLLACQFSIALNFKDLLIEEFPFST